MCKSRTSRARTAGGLVLACALWVWAPGQGAFAQAGTGESVESGQVQRGGQSVHYRIRHLPVSSFPDLPQPVAARLNELGCMIPQTYQAHRPENVIHGSLESAGSSDWAALCSAQGNVSLIVIFGRDPGRYERLSSSPETEHLQPSDGSGDLGFNWGIDPASPDAVHEAQIGLVPRPHRLDHDSIADSVIDHRTIYHFYSGTWTTVEMPG